MFAQSGCDSGLQHHPVATNATLNDRDCFKTWRNPMSQPNQQTYQFQCHEPERTTLYKLVQANWLTFQEQVHFDMGYPLPDFVIKEFDEYLR